MKIGANNILKKTIIFLLSTWGLSLHAQFQVNGNADSLSCECFLLTHAINNENGSVWYKNTISLTDTFDAVFSVYLGTEDVWGADGIVFAFQQMGITALGGDGSPKGFNGISPSVGVGIDTHDGAPNDIPEDHLAVYTNGNTTVDAAGPVPALSNGGDIEDGQYHELHIFWDPATTTLYIYFDGVLRLTYTNDIINNIFGGNPNVYFGFTGATGGLNNEQRFCIKNTADFDVQNFCTGSPTEFTNTSNFLFDNNITYSWDFGDGNTSSQTNPSHNYNTSGNYTVTLAAEDYRGCQDTMIKIVNIYEAGLTVTAAPDTLCGINQAQLSAVTTTDYEPSCYYYLSLSDLWGDGWDGASLDVYVNGQLQQTFAATDFGFSGTPTTETDSILLVNNQTVTLNYNSGSYEYEHSYSFSDFAGNILFSDGPSPATGNVYTTTVTCPQNNTVSVSWLETSYLDNPNSFSPIANISATQTFHVTVTHSFGCVLTDSLELVYKNGDSPGLDNEVTLCSSSDSIFMLDSLKGNPVNYGVWYDSNNNITNGYFNPQVQLSDTFYYVISGPNVCADSSAQLIIHVEPQPFAGLDNVIDVCENTVAFALFDSLLGNPDAGGYWTDSLFNPHTGIYQPGSDTSGNFYYIVDNGTVCPSDTASVLVRERPLPQVVLLETNQVSCFGYSDGQISVQVTGNTPFSYQWNIGQQNDVVQVGAGIYSITVTDKYGCQSAETISVAEPPPLKFDSIQTLPATCKNTCDGLIALYFSGGTPPYSVLWNFNDTNTTANQLCEGIYGVTVTDAHNCILQNDTLQVFSIDSLNASFIYASENYIAPADIVFYNTTTGKDSVTLYFWDFEVAESNEENPQITFSDTGRYEVVLTVQNSRGCTDTAMQIVYIKGESFIQIPNVFSPNNDGLNDNFLIKSYGYQIENIMIYNRWGEKINELSGVNIWDGTAFSGRAVPSGVYYYVLEIKDVLTGDKQSLKGYVQLIK
ncbi:MAG: PKD domain-containing protein [Bacteroidetes bacterium]|nr:MAG: PKD domain-containing protein [Bacteroidota bacterium]